LILIKSSIEKFCFESFEEKNFVEFFSLFDSGKRLFKIWTISHPVGNVLIEKKNSENLLHESFEYISTAIPSDLSFTFNLLQMKDGN